MSLTIVAAALSDFVPSAWLDAAICTVADAGRIAGAVYTPSGVIVPDAALPPGVPFTDQLTAVSAVFVTCAENGIAFPSITDPLFGEIVTATDGGGGGGGKDRPAPPPPQPIVHAPVAGRTHRKILAVRNLFRSNGERGRIPSAKQAKGLRKT
jgi:hypothetical protein